MLKLIVEFFAVWFNRYITSISVIINIQTAS